MNLLAKYDEEIKRIEHHRANETEDIISDMEEIWQQYKRRL